MCLNQEYGTGTDANHTLGWPEDIKEARQAILDARARLHPYAHNGQTYEEAVAQSKEFWDSIKDIMKPTEETK